MASGSCNCDEVQQLRAENARLNGVIQGMREGLEMLTQTPTPKRCARTSTVSCSRCELPAGHAGCHRSGQVVF